MSKAKSELTLTGLKRKYESMSDALRGRDNDPCWIYSAQWGQYWGPNRCGYTPYREVAPPNCTAAGKYTFKEALEATWHCGPEKLIQFHFEGGDHA